MFRTFMSINNSGVISPRSWHYPKLDYYIHLYINAIIYDMNAIINTIINVNSNLFWHIPLNPISFFSIYILLLSMAIQV